MLAVLFLEWSLPNAFETMITCSQARIAELSGLLKSGLCYTVQRIVHSFSP